MPNEKSQWDRNAPWSDDARDLTWSEIVQTALRAWNGQATLHELYSSIERHPRTKKREHWKAKVRQVLEASDQFVRVERGTWSFSSKYPAKTLRKLRIRRRKLYPKRPDAAG